jgi:hypothetical protein
LAYNTEAILLDVGNKPIPQYFDGTTYQPQGKDVEIAPTGIQSSANFTRPNDTTNYTAGDVVGSSPAANMTFTNVGATNELACIMNVHLSIANNAVPPSCAGYRLHLYTSAPTAIADNAAFTLGSDLAKHAGWIDIGIPTLLGTACVAQATNVNLVVNLASTNLYGILQAKGSETPAAAKVYTVTMNVTGI